MRNRSSIQQLVKSLRHYIQSLNRSELTGKRLGPAVTVYFPPLADSPRAADGFLNSSLTIWLKTVPSIQERISKERTPPKTNYVTSLEQAFIGGSFLFVQFQDVFQDDYRLFLHVQAFTSRIFPQNPEPHLSWTISCLSFIGLWLIRGNVGSCSPWASVPLKRLWFAAHRSTFHLPSDLSLQFSKVFVLLPGEVARVDPREIILLVKEPLQRKWTPRAAGLESKIFSNPWARISSPLVD